MTEKFYHDIAALKQHSTALAEYRATDFNSWIIDHLEPRTGDNILDIGSGSGKRTLALARAVGETGHVLAIDSSYENLNTLSQRSLENGLETRIRFLQMNINELDGHLREEDFDRALSSHALYHIRQPRSVFNAIHLALKTGSVFFFYGPSRKDHAELKRFHAALRDEISPYENQEPTFIEGVGVECARDFFSAIEIVKFEQSLRFTSPEDLYACWSASSLYDEQLDGHFRQAAVHHFQSHTVFETVQRVIGIKAIK